MTILLRHKILKLLSCMFACVLFTSNAFAVNYTVTYDCGYYNGTPPAQTTATGNASFTPASTANNCGQMNGATLTGWLVSGTNDVKSAGVSFTWEYDEDKTLTAVWSCYPNIDETACVQGYKITLTIGPNGNIQSSFPLPLTPTIPDTLYTIPTRGAYIDISRTKLMTASDNSIIYPTRPFTTSYDTNAPTDPTTGNQYYINSVPDSEYGYGYGCFLKSDNVCRIGTNGYITSDGISDAENTFDNQNWYISYGGVINGYVRPTPTLTGYHCDGWYDDPGNQGTRVIMFGMTVHPETLYAHWTPNKYTVIYDKGAHATSGSTNYSDAFDTDIQTGGATFDSPYTPLSFASAPISNNMSADTGYVFAGWTTDPSPTFTNGTLDNQYTGDTWWKRTSALNLYAAYDCDTANGYAWNNEHTACVRPTYNVTYYSGNCSLGHATDSFDTTYSTTDSTHPATGDTYTILMGSTNPDLSTVFQSINGFTYPDSNYTGNGMSCVDFTGWRDANSNTYGWSLNPNAPPPSISPYGSDDTNLYAICTWLPIEIGYYPGTCSGNGNREYVGIYGTSFNMPTATAEGISVPSGYTFQGWSLSPTATTVDYAVGASYTPGVCIYTNEKAEPYYKFYAVCAPNEYTITYDANGHGSYTDGYTAATNIFGPGRDYGGGTYGQTWQAKAMGTSHIIANTCELFCGWSTNPNDTCSNQNLFVGGQWQGVWNYTNDITLYAIWQCASGCANNNGVCVPIVTHDVTYNQGNCIIPKGSYLENAVPEGQYNLATANTAQITPNGNPPCCHFDGWSLTDPTTSEAPVELLSSPVDLTSDMTVYGVCNCDTVTVIYHGCDGSTTFTDYPQGMSFNILSYAATGLSSQGYTFEDKWNTGPNGSGDSYAENSVYTVKYCDGSGSIIIDLYAVCTQNAPTEYHIYYHNVISSDTWTGGQPTTYTYGTGASVGTPNRTNYVFLGWCVGADNCNNYATNVNGYTISSTSIGDIDLYAQWDCDTNYVWNSNHTECVIAQYTVTYVANAPNGATVTGMPANNPVTVTVGTTYVLADTPTADGYTNQGWYCTDENNNEVEQINNIAHLNNGNEITMPASNVTCTAQWGDKPILLLWNPDGGTPSSIASPSSCIYGSQAGQPGGINGITQPTKPGFTFMGWLLTNWECDLSTINSSINGNSFTQSSTGSPEGTWEVTFSYGSLSGESRCTSSDTPTSGQPDPCPVSGSMTEIDATCNACFCKVTGYTPTNGQMCHVSSLEWTYYGQFTGSCIQSCPNFCGLYIRSNYGNFRLKVLGLQ